MHLRTFLTKTICALNFPFFLKNKQKIYSAKKLLTFYASNNERFRKRSALLSFYTYANIFLG